MAKVARRYLVVDDWAVTEKGFHPDRAEVSESVFSLANEYMGVRGYFEEGYGGPRLVGSYFNAVFEQRPHVYPTVFKGFAAHEHFMVNAVALSPD